MIGEIQVVLGNAPLQNGAAVPERPVVQVGAPAAAGKEQVDAGRIPLGVSDIFVAQSRLHVHLYLFQARAAVPRLDVKLPRPFDEIILAAGIFHQKLGGGHVVGKSRGIGLHRPDGRRENHLRVSTHPIHLEAQIPADHFLRNEFRIVAKTAAVEIAENHLSLLQRKPHKNLPAKLQVELVDLLRCAKKPLDDGQQRRTFFDQLNQCMHRKISYKILTV